MLYILYWRCTLPDLSLDKDAIELFGEILKVLFNVTINISQEQPEPDLQQSCDNLIFILRHMLIKCKELSQEPKNLQNNIINMLINLPYQSYNLLYWQIPKKEAKEIMKNFESDNSKNKHPIVYEVCIMQKHIWFMLNILVISAYCKTILLVKLVNKTICLCLLFIHWFVVYPNAAYFHGLKTVSQLISYFSNAFKTH